MTATVVQFPCPVHPSRHAMTAHHLANAQACIEEASIHLNRAAASCEIIEPRASRVVARFDEAVSIEIAEMRELNNLTGR